MRRERREPGTRGNGGERGGEEGRRRGEVDKGEREAARQEHKVEGGMT